MSVECLEHERVFDLNTGAHVCARCGTPWDLLKTRKTLYCATFMVRTPTGWAADMVYMHCDSVEEARLQFFQSEARTVRQVAIAPVVGWLADDEHGDKVSA